MPPLASDLHKQLENVCIQARDLAEASARSALQKRALDVAEPFSHFGPEEKDLRNRLRARGRQVGDVRYANGTQAIDQLAQELAYEHWHRMLFARFLAENHLLMHPDGVAVSLEECEELAKDAEPPAPNGFVLAARYASTMLPQIFRTDDVLLEIEFAPEQRLKLEKLLVSLPRQTFLADDSLGWVYQFWQSKKKEEVNKSGDKIDGRTLSAVTQLFTEHYMVEFLLHNTIGAWWCARQGIAVAASLMAKYFTLVATNVPYIARGKQDETMRTYLANVHPAGKADLATAFVERCLEYCAEGGSSALVTPQNWLFLGSYKGLREWMLRQVTWNMVAKLGPGAFETISGEVVNVALLIHTAAEPVAGHELAGLDASEPRVAAGKAAHLLERECASAPQKDQLRHPDARVSLDNIGHHALLEAIATNHQGLSTGDNPRFRRLHWEVSGFGALWEPEQSTVEESEHYGGRSGIVLWEGGKGQLWQFGREKVPFDLEHWQKVAAEEYPDGLPKPHSDDPTQWLFRGHPKGSTDPLQVTVARLLGYRWPDQEPGSLDTLADADGIVPIPAVRGEPPAAERLREVLKAAFVGQAFQPDDNDDDEHVRLESLTYNLLTEAGCKSGTTLDDWLRNQFFEQHCKRFHNRPFVWHIWDGRKDGFSCLVNYHKLNRVRLESLTYSYLGDWITAHSRSDSVGADLRLAAAQTLQEKLKRILAGEPPHDIFVRWKPLHQQAIGWHPDLNDGVRMNIRPFIKAEILRKNPNIKWTKDRGKEPERPQSEYPWFWHRHAFIGDRVNDVHLTIAQKQAARP
jgi:hypothetical protein